MYDLPVHWLWNNGPARLLNDWQASGIVTAQSGSPFTVVLAGAPASSAAAFGNPARPDLVGDPFAAGPVAANPSCSAPAQVRTPQSWFNPCAFVAPVGAAFGTEGRNILTGPGFTDIDFSLAKSMALGSENHRLQFRGDFFNLFNHPNFDIPGHVFECPPQPQVCSPHGGPSYGGPGFGKLLSANGYGTKPPRQIQLSLRFGF